MTRRASKIDANQTQIVRELEGLGCSVWSLAREGGGCPDLLVGYERINLLMEVKDPTSKRGKMGLNKAQRKWHASWKGQVAVVHSAPEAVECVLEAAKEVMR
jgi:hypothetical protein